ncbi:hypothetical protein N7509_000235 [Penicillium cosmopolitanum]|uniref:Uncharacterized protein n=1 Tax=Penicillium cosmopolitanum TaxID=1131564 RepID=A0A9X0BF43_9EURO|nr:uncharacterized protein N7509_000235 [Penicillium cosmopolitanum]KAJ5414901.1 hypothetical protein N7509_000235 [Penicillium cosmopolitanum]
MSKHFWERLRSANSSISTNTTIPLTFASSLGQNGVRSSTSDADFEKSLHLSVALAGMVVRLIIQVHIKKNGYALSWRWLHSSDFMVWVAMGVVMVFWTTFEFLSAWLFEDTVHACIRRCKDPCPEKTAANSCIEACANPCPRKRRVLPYFARLVFVPWFLIAAFTWWALSYLLYHFFFSSSWRDDRRPLSSLDPGYKVYSYLFALNPRSYSPTRGEARISIQALRLLTIAVNFMIIFTAIGAFIDELYTASATQIAALIVSFHAGPRHYFDAEKPHKSRLDDIRIPLSGHIDQCLIYILHSRCSNFDVKHLVRLESEHNAVDTYRLKMEELEVDTSKFNLKE